MSISSTVLVLAFLLLLLRETNVVASLVLEEAAAEEEVETQEYDNSTPTCPETTIRVLVETTENGGGQHATDDQYVNQLVYFARVGDLDRCERLMKEQRGDIVDIPDEHDGNTPLMVASSSNHPHVVKFLLENGADPTIANGKTGRTALMQAAFNGSMEALTTLLLIEQEQSDVIRNDKDDDGNTPLMLAVLGGHADIVGLLLDIGEADPNVNDNEGRSTIVRAAERDDVAVLKVLVDHAQRSEQGIDINSKSVDGNTALMVAISHGHSEAVEFLLENGADPTVKDREGWPAIIHAATSGSVSVLRLLVEHARNSEQHIDDFRTEERGDTALMAAARHGRSEMVELLLESGADPNARCGTFVNTILETTVAAAYRIPIDFQTVGVTALMDAARHGRAEIIKILLEHGADPNAESDFGITAIMYATAGMYWYDSTQSDHVDAVSVLLESGADPNVADKYGSTALMLAAINGTTAIMEILLSNHSTNDVSKQSTDVDVQDVNGNTALILASWYGHADSVAFLLEKGADLCSTNKSDMTAFIAAAKNGTAVIVKLIFDHDKDTKQCIDVNARSEGNTALMLASLNGHEDVVAFLLDIGANPNIVNKGGETALMLASQNGEIGVLKLLINRGVDVRAKSKVGISARQIAQMKGQLEAVEFLVENGAESNYSLGELFTSILLLFWNFAVVFLGLTGRWLWEIACKVLIHMVVILRIMWMVFFGIEKAILIGR